MDFLISCDNCSKDLVVDSQLTSEYYLSDPTFILKETGEIVEESLQNYLVYRCSDCEKIYKYTYKEWERRYREKLARYVESVKKRIAFKAIPSEEVDPDKGLEFCGKCSGYDDSGNCFKGIIKNCMLRRTGGV